MNASKTLPKSSIKQNKRSKHAIYAGLGYSVVGECHMFEQDFM